MQSPDIQRLTRIRDYCRRIGASVARLNGSYEAFADDVDIQQSIAFSILQIGELVSKLSDDLKSETKSHVDWRAIKGMRNIIAHDYGQISLKIVWDVASTDIPALKKFCEERL